MAHAAFAADGSADGWVEVADSTPFYPGAHVWLKDDNSGAEEYIITDVDDTTNLIGVRKVLGAAGSGGARYGRTPVDHLTLAQNATIDQESQPVPVEWDHVKVPRP
jgi:hypothetical protein